MERYWVTNKADIVVGNPGKRALWLAATMLFMLILVQQMAPPSPYSQLGAAIRNSAHTPWFFPYTLLLWLLIKGADRFNSRRRVQIWLATAFSLAIGLEALQIFSSRQASLEDVALNLAGGGAAIALIAGWQHWRTGLRFRPFALWTLGFALILAGMLPVGRVLWLQYQRDAMAPTLLSLEHKNDITLSNLRGAWELVPGLPQWPGHESRTLALVTLRSSSRWPGLTLREPLPDWRPYQHLEISAYLDEPQSLPLYVRLDRYSKRGVDTTQPIMMEPGINQIRIPISDLAGTDAGSVNDVRNLMIFSDAQHGGRQLYLSSIRLNKAGADATE